MANAITVKDTTLGIGDTIKVHYSFNEGGKKKLQIFEGILMAIKGMQENKMFMVRKMTKSKVGVERIFPVNSPFIDKVDVAKKGNRTTSKNILYPWNVRPTYPRTLKLSICSHLALLANKRLRDIFKNATSEFYIQISVLKLASLILLRKRKKRWSLSRLSRESGIFEENRTKLLITERSIILNELVMHTYLQITSNMLHFELMLCRSCTTLI